MNGGDKQAMHVLHHLTGHVVGYVVQLKDCMMFIEDAMKEKKLYGVQVSKLLYHVSSFWYIYTCPRDIQILVSRSTFT